VRENAHDACVKCAGPIIRVNLPLSGSFTLTLSPLPTAHSSDEAQMAAGAKTLDLILDTIGAEHDVNAEGGLLATDGTIVLIGLVPKPMSYAVPNFLFSRHTVTGSLIGGMKRTQGASTSVYTCVGFVFAREGVRESASTDKRKDPASLPFLMCCKGAVNPLACF